MASVCYNGAKEKMLGSGIDFTTNTVKAMIITGTSTTPDDPDHEFVADISADEMTDASYSRITLGTKTVTRNDTANTAEADSADWAFGNVDNETARYLVTYIEVTNDSDSWLWSCHDVSDIALDGSGYTGIVGSNGFFNIA